MLNKYLGKMNARQLVYMLIFTRLIIYLSYMLPLHALLPLIINRRLKLF